MVFRTLGVSVVPNEGERVFTGPMMLAGLTLAACALTRLSGLDHAGISFCYFKALTGHACLTCGTTRAFGHLSRFNLPAAFAIQPLVTTGALALVAWGLVDGALLLASKRTIIRMEGSVPWIVTAVMLVLALINWMYLLAIGV